MKIYKDRAIYEDVKAMEKNQVLLFNSFLFEINSNKIINISTNYIKYRNCQDCLEGKNQTKDCGKCGSNHNIVLNYYGWDGDHNLELECSHCGNI